MSNYLSDNNSFSVSSVQSTLLPQYSSDQILQKEISRTQDTIDSAQKREKKQQVNVGQRPSLPPAGKSGNTQYLMIVAEAFSKSFQAMSEGTIQQAKSYADLQQLDETMSQSVLQSTKIAIDKEEKEMKMASAVQAYQKKCAKEDKIFGDVMLAIGIVLIVATVVSAIFDAGASLAAVPEEVAAVSTEAGGEAAAEAGGEIGAQSLEDVETDTFVDSSMDEDVDPEIDEGEGENTTSQINEGTDSADTQGTNEANQTERSETDELDQSNKDESKSEDSFKKKVGKKLMHMAVAAGFGAPMLMQGLQGLKTASMQEDVATTQKQVGAALATLQENNSYFQFYQQVLQQAGGVVQEETNDSSQVVETFGSIANAYQQISYGLSSAV